MLYDVVEQAYVIANANFATDLAALTTAKGIAALGTVIPIKRQSAEASKEMLRASGTLVRTLGIYGRRVVTQAKDQQKRDSKVTLVYDLYLEGADPSLLTKHVELGIEALLMCVDRLAASGGGVYGAGELRESVSVELSDGKDVAPNFWHRALVLIPVNDRDTIP